MLKFLKRLRKYNKIAGVKNCRFEEKNRNALKNNRYNL